MMRYVSLMSLFGVPSDPLSGALSDPLFGAPSEPPTVPSASQVPESQLTIKLSYTIVYDGLLHGFAHEWSTIYPK
jgi:hypothetical protein